MKIAVAQLGARRHYAVPFILNKAGLLSKLYTDICANKGWPQAIHLLPDKVLPAPLKRLADRTPRGVAKDKIRAFNLFGLEYWLRRFRDETKNDGSLTKIWGGRSFCKKIITDGLDESDTVYTFNGQGLELLSFAQEHGLLSIMEQTIAPKEKEIELLAEEKDRFEKWTHACDYASPGEKRLAEREKDEWEHADLILCGSDFVKKGIRDCDGPVEKCRVIPYGTDLDRFRDCEVITRSGVKSPVRVVTVGSVGLRKGSPYVLQAARKLKGNALFRMVGAVSLPIPARSELEAGLELIGHVPRSRVAAHYEWADIFLLPSLCEGSAGVTYEAMAHGLPVICTPNTGSIVRDGQDGFIVPIRDAEAIAERIMHLAEDEDLYRGMSRSAKQRAVTAGSVEAYGKRLIATLQSVDALYAN